jgi:hypothetical protein
MREEWVQRNYYVSDGSLGYSLKPYYGQLILSKLPFHRSAPLFLLEFETC